MTKNADLVLNIINNSNDHLSAEEILLLIRKSDLKISLATVYNSLNYLENNRLIIKIPLGKGIDVYDKTLRHDHLICYKCGKIKDVFLDDLTDFFEQKTGIKIDSYDLRLNYLCEDCKDKEENKVEN